MGVEAMVLECRRCKRTIEPDEPMVVVMIEKPSSWQQTSGERLERAPGRWHYRCAPIPVRKYVGAVYGGSCPNGEQAKAGERGY